MPHAKNIMKACIDKLVDFGKQIFAATLRSRTGSLSELAKLLRFQSGTPGFHRMYEKLLPLRKILQKVFMQCVKAAFGGEGLRLGILDDSPIKKTGKKFPKETIQHDHESNAFFDGLRVLTSIIYQNGKTAAISSELIGKEDNKLEVAIKKVKQLIKDFLVDIILFDSWYSKNPLIDYLVQKKILFITRVRKDTKTLFAEDEERLDALAKSIPHLQYKLTKIYGKSYWITDLTLDLKTYGKLRVIISKEGQFDEPIFILTNIQNFSASFIVKLYLRRFTIETFFKDAKQYLNLETFQCRKQSKWDLHLLLINILHWAIQMKNSISKTVRAVRENIDACLLFINENERLRDFFERTRKKCQT